MSGRRTGRERLLVLGPTKLDDGISRFNRSFISGCLDRGHQVTALSVGGYEAIEGVAELGFPDPPPEGKTLSELEGHLWSHMTPAIDRYRTQNDHQDPTMIVINGKFRHIGPQMKDILPDARLVQVNHNLSYYTEHPMADGKWFERHYQSGFASTMQRTDLGVGVGPALSADLLRVGAPHVLEAAPPTVTSKHGDAQRAQRAAERVRDPAKPVRFLLYGRLGDPAKGMSTALGAIRELQKQGRRNARLTLLGVPPDELSDEQAAADRLLGPGVVECLPYTDDDRVIQEQRDRADVVLMPSLGEGFGLVASESFSEGTPVLVTESSGAGLFLSDPDRMPPQLRDRFVVRDEDLCRALINKEGDPRLVEGSRQKRWGVSMGKAMDEYPQYLHLSKGVRDRLLAGKFTEGHLADAIVHGARSLPGEHGKQGPGGVILPAAGTRDLGVSVGPTMATLKKAKSEQKLHTTGLRASREPQAAPGRGAGSQLRSLAKDGAASQREPRSRQLSIPTRRTRSSSGRDDEPTR